MDLMCHFVRFEIHFLIKVSISGFHIKFCTIFVAVSEQILCGLSVYNLIKNMELNIDRKFQFLHSESLVEPQVAWQANPVIV